MEIDLTRAREHTVMGELRSANMQAAGAAEHVIVRLPFEVHSGSVVHRNVADEVAMYMRETAAPHLQLLPVHAQYANELHFVRGDDPLHLESLHRALKSDKHKDKGKRPRGSGSRSGSSTYSTGSMYGAEERTGGAAAAAASSSTSRVAAATTKMATSRRARVSPEAAYTVGMDVEGARRELAKLRSKGTRARTPENASEDALARFERVIAKSCDVSARGAARSALAEHLHKTGGFSTATSSALMHLHGVDMQRDSDTKIVAAARHAVALVSGEPAAGAMDAARCYKKKNREWRGDSRKVRGKFADARASGVLDLRKANAFQLVGWVVEGVVWTPDRLIEFDATKTPEILVSKEAYDGVVATVGDGIARGNLNSALNANDVYLSGAAGAWLEDNAPTVTVDAVMAAIKAHYNNVFAYKSPVEISVNPGGRGDLRITESQ